MGWLFHTFFSYFARGGVLMWPIFMVSLVAWFMGLEKAGFLRAFNKSRKKYYRAIAHILAGKPHDENTGFEPYDLLLHELKHTVSKDHNSCACKLLWREFLIAAVPSLEKGFNSMSAWISVAPLLGLLGTVSGMIETFRVITDYGLGNPNLTAEGISVALITTQAGLTVAFPMMLFHNFLVTRSHAMVSRLLMDGETLVNRIKSRDAGTKA